MRAFMLTLGLVATLSVAATPLTVYKNVQPDGTIVYSDKPDEGAKELKLPEIQIYTPPPLPEGDDRAANGGAAGFTGYESFAISSPANDETVRDNGGSVSIALTLKPSLQSGHVVDIRMDGASIGRGSSTSITLTNVDRGSHTVQAAVLDGDGAEVARTDSVTFHLKRASAIKP